MVWLLVGVRSCVAAEAGHSLVTPSSLSGRLRTDRAYDSRQVTDLLSRAHTCVWVLGKLVALLSRIRLFPDRLLGFVCFWWRRSLHRTESRTQGRGLRVLVWTGTWTPGIGERWVGPACAWGTSGPCVFGVPSWRH